MNIHRVRVRVPAATAARTAAADDAEEDYADDDGGNGHVIPLAKRHKLSDQAGIFVVTKVGAATGKGEPTVTGAVAKPCLKTTAGGVLGEGPTVQQRLELILQGPGQRVGSGVSDCRETCENTLLRAWLKESGRGPQGVLRCLSRAYLVE